MIHFDEQFYPSLAKINYMIALFERKFVGAKAISELEFDPLRLLLF